MRLGLIETAERDEDFRARFGGFADLFRALLGPERFEVVPLRGYRSEYPERLDAFDGYIVPGSLASAYDDADWIRDLFAAIRALHARSIPVAGVCFGHQALAAALGGEVRRAPAWRLGMKEVSWDAEVAPWLAPPSTTRIYATHHDEVARLPPGAVQVARGAESAIQAFRLGRTVLGVQCHPEFTPEVATHFLDRNDVGIDAETIGAARASLAGGHDHARVGEVLARFFLASRGAP